MSAFSGIAGAPGGAIKQVAARVGPAQAAERLRVGGDGGAHGLLLPRRAGEGDEFTDEVEGVVHE